MKKILFAVVLSCFMGCAFADYDFSSAIQNSSMPTDAEIMEILDKLNIDESQKKEIFEQTKKNLAQMYYFQDASKTNEQLNQYYRIMNDEQMGQYVDNSTKKEVNKALSKLPSTSSNSSSSSTKNTVKVKSSTSNSKSSNFQSKPKFQVQGFKGQ